MKADERQLLERLVARGHEAMRPSAVGLSQSLNMNYKRARYIFLKWTDRNWFDYGVSWRVGWLTEEFWEMAELPGEA
jgi:hypothetical protein